MKTTKADTWFSRWIRLRDAWESNGVLVNKCFTCGRMGEAKRMDNSHYMPRIHNPTRWDEVNCEPACTHCNWTLEGNKDEFSKRIDIKHGAGTADGLRTKARGVSKVNKDAIAICYKAKVEALLNERGWQKYKWW